MRSRASLVLFLFFILLIIVLAQNGSLNGLVSGVVNSTPNFYSITARPFATTGAPIYATVAPGNSIMPTAYLPTSYLPPAYAPTYPGAVSQPQQPLNVTAAAPVAGVRDANGQCIVPNGWIPYTIQSGETLAGIAQSYNLTVDQLAAANCLDNPDLIYEGQVLAVPPQQ
jgi:hypothetical protein